MVTKPVVDMVNPFVKVMQNKVPEYKRICSLLSIKRPYSSKYSKDIFPRFIRYFINSKCSKISMKEYDDLISNKYINEVRAKKCDHSIKVLLDSTHLTFPAIMIALGYISNLKKNTITSSLLHHQNNSEVKILTLALMASMKAHYDNVYSNKSWSTVSGIPLRELNIIESNFLHDINFNLFINEKIFFDYMDRVENSLSEYYKIISDKKNKNEINTNTETFENSNIPSKEIKYSGSFKSNSVNLTPDASPQCNESKYEPRISESDTKPYSFVPENNYKSKKYLSNSPSNSNCKSPINQLVISTPSIYSTETSFSSEFSELSLPQNKNNNKNINENSFQIYHTKNYDEINKQQNAYHFFDNHNESNIKDSKQIKNRFNFLNQSSNNNDIKYSKSLGFYNTNKFTSMEESQQSILNKSKSRKYLSSSIPSFLYKYQQKVENGEYIKYLDDLDTNAKEITGKKSEANYITNNEKLNSSPIQNSKIEIIHSSPVPINRNFTNKQYSKDKRYNKNDNDQHEIPKRTSSNDFHKLLPKRASSTNLNAQYNKSYNENIGSGIKQSKSISIAYQTKPNQQMVDSSNQLFRHKTVSLTTTVATSSVYANYPQGHYAIPVYQQQVASVQQVIPYYIPQNSSKIGVILDTNMVQQPLPIPPNSTILQAQPIPPNPMPSPISPQSIVYSNGITIRHQNSFQSNYSTPSPYIGSVISSSINTNVYYQTENNISTPVHIISPPPIINPITNYTYNTSSQDNSDYNGFSKLKEKEKVSDNNNFDHLSRKSYTSITDNSSYDSLYYHDIVDNNSMNNEHDNSTSHIAKRSNTIGGYQDIRSELSNKGNIPSQYLHPNSSAYSYSTSNNSYGYDNSISRSNSYNFENNIVRVKTYSHETNIGINTRHSYSYDGNLRKSTPSDIYRNNSYDSTASISNSGYYEPSISYSYISSSYPIINGTYRSNSYASSTSSMINDTGSYYSNNSKRQSNTSSYYKKKQNNKYSSEYLNEDKSIPFYRKDISTYKNRNKSSKYNNNENKELNRRINNINIKNTENIENDQESIINLSNSSSKKDYEVKSKAESETYVASIKTNRDSIIDKYNEKDQKSETIEVELYSNSGISNSSLIDNYINESSYSLQSDTNKKETTKAVIVENIKNHYDNELKNDNDCIDDVNDKTDVNESSNIENEDEDNAIFSTYNVEINSNKIRKEYESRRYSSISTYNLDSLEKDGQSYLMKDNKYRYSDYTDFISERDSLKNTEEDSNSYLSSMTESNSDENTDSNINLYINNEDIGSIKSYVSSMDDYYYLKSENSKNEIVNNTNYSSKTSNFIDNHTLLDKVPRSTNANMIKFGLKKAFRTNSTPIYSKTNNHISEDKSWNNSNNSSDQEIMEKYKNLSESKSMDKDTSIVNGRQEPKIIKIRTSKRSGIKKTMSLILESSSKIFTKKQNQQNQNQSQSKGINVNIPYYANKELPPIPSNKDLFESAKEELKLTKKKHHSFTQPASIGSHLLLKLDRDASFAASSSFSKPGSIHYVEPTSISSINDSNDENNK
ncbi:hypothetical protein H8356DRAFT_1029986 [Neocallimastix lanati (nom. inval.)]|uniref:Cyclin N-terminal domain-containing protein n=1 Tax=Neocallimastix californiae TaxID=1754190 RepID=A0A1Y2EPL4_9FUNG|nr:hypothetical protein H8356DRAFT_1029986 [Neocallimastix sp. JGI-2020a]ORY73523.1 hypothetical protein LY90DRAFT_666615 [Neocallimastix californiae]|eukprot:ORY73523.1 hypothetical protein LY90DRAFT_666615 [Neocallimastix californiae]